MMRQPTIPAALHPKPMQMDDTNMQGSVPKERKIPAENFSAGIFAKDLRKLEHTGIKLIVFALFGNQFLMVAFLDDFAVLQHDDNIGVAHR